MNTPASVQQLIDSTPARVGLSVIHLSGAPGFGCREDEVFTQASAIKIPVLWTLNRLAAEGALSLDETLTIDPTNGTGGCGVLQSFESPGTRIALRDLAAMMIVLSDNVATNLLIDRVGFDAVNELITDAGGGEETRLRRKMIDFEARAAGRENTANPTGAASLMLRLAEYGCAGNQAALATLRTLGLKKESPVTAALPDGIDLATKPGMLDGLRTEWSVVRFSGRYHHHFAMSLMADGADDTELEPLFHRLAASVFEHVTEGDRPRA